MNTIRSQLEQLADSKFQAFHSRLCPGVQNILGVKIPQLRKLAKTLAKQPLPDALAQLSDDTYEEILLQGLTIGYAKLPLPERLRAIEAFVPKINNWAVCDTFCATLSFAKQEPAAVWSFLQPYFFCEDAFSVRFAVVMLLDYFITPLYCDAVLSLLEQIHHPDYYVKMAVAWAISVCFVKEREKTLSFLQNNTLDRVTQNKAIQKIRESLRVAPEDKTLLLRYKRA